VQKQVLTSTRRGSRHEFHDHRRRGDRVTRHGRRSHFSSESATATAIVSSRKIVGISIDDLGSGYTTPPGVFCLDRAEGAFRCGKQNRSEANKKTAQAEANREQKKFLYLSDPLFIYLWRRKFGTSDYPSGFFVRFFDAKIAALINYRGARANYAMLNQIPERLRDPANRVGAELNTERQKLAAFEQDRLIAAGGGPLQKKAAEAKAALDASEALPREMLDQQYQAIAGRDNNGAFTQAIALMAEDDSRDHFRTLYHEAERTKTEEDRLGVERIDRFTQPIARAEQEIAQLRGQIREVASRRAEIEAVRRKFRQRGYDYPGTTFGMRRRCAWRHSGGRHERHVLGQVLDQGYRRPPASNWGGGGMFPGPMYPPSGHFSEPQTDPPSGGDGFRTGGSF
jgi:hypothetical protein